MKVAILGTNGLLANRAAYGYKHIGCEVFLYGLEPPRSVVYDRYIKMDILDESFDYSVLMPFEVIIYAIGAGIQTNKKENSDLIYKLNVLAPILLCSQLDAMGYKGTLISFGSYFEIGNNNEHKRFSEEEIITSLLTVPNDYSLSKRLFTRFAQNFHGGFRLLHFILPNIYGEEESSHRLIPSVISAIRNGRNIQFTSGLQVRQYLYIEEVTNILTEASVTLNMPSGIYNIPGTETISVRELVANLFSYYNLKVPDNAFTHVVRGDASMKYLALNGDKLYSSISYRPVLKLKDIYKRYEDYCK